jgi:hypothetical protein
MNCSGVAVVVALRRIVGMLLCFRVIASSTAVGGQEGVDFGRDLGRG